MIHLKYKTVTEKALKRTDKTIGNSLSLTKFGDFKSGKSDVNSDDANYILKQHGVKYQ